MFTLCLCVTTGCKREETRRAQGMVWHTEYHITYTAAAELNDSIIKVFDEVGASLNAFDETSLTGRVNSGDSIEVDRQFVDVYQESVRVNKLTGGAFDPTLGPLITAWGFGKGHKATADTLRIDSLLQITGIGKTRLEGMRLIKGDRRIEFNFSAIAKGYGCDRVGEMLTRNGSADWLVEVGGEIRCQGKSPSGKPWRVSIDRPVLSESVVHDSECVILLSDCGLATSGNYRNYQRDEQGNAYGHTISAKTGRPAHTDILSASVVAPTCMEADALATSMMAMGSSDAKRLAEQLKYPILLVLSDMSVWTTPEFDKIMD